jgi:ParB family chromosome partitioning protein
LDELVQSVRERGVLQPLLVRAAGEGYELIAGERRLRAAVAAGLAEVPVRTMAVSDREALELALIENLQREDLDPIEEAEGYRMLGERFQLTQEQIAERVGKGRASVANAMRLLGLPEAVRVMLEDGRLSVGHAKVLLGLSIPQEMESLARQSVKDGGSVRDLERAVDRLRRGPRRRRSALPDVPAPHVRDIEDRLKQKLGSSVQITPSRTLANGRKASGRIEIEFYSADDLDRLMLILGLTEEF